MSSNITGSSNLQDLSLLVQNLQNTVNNVSTAFSTVQTNISNLNQVDTVHNQKFAQINALDGEQEQEIEELKVDDANVNNRLNMLELKFPITDVSILNETISKSKIKDLTSDLTSINNNINVNSQRITDLNTLHNNDVQTFATNLNNQITKQANDNTTITNNFNTLLSSVPGSQNTFQIQIDTIKTNQLTDEGNISTLQTNVSSLQSDNSTNKTNINNLQSDNTVNKLNIISLQNGLSSANTNIANNTSSINTLNTNVSALTVKEEADFTNLSNRIDNLSTQSGTNNTSLQTQITNLSNKQNTDYNDLQTQITNNNNARIAGDTTLNGLITDLNTKVDTNNNNLSTSLNAQIAKENNDISNLQSQLTTYKTTNDARNVVNENNINNNSASINSNTNEINSLKSRVSVNETVISVNSAKISGLEADVSVNKTNITNNTNDIITINNKLINDESNISTLLNDVHNLKIYDISNNSNINTINTTLTNHTTDINTLKNTTLPNLDNKYLKLDGTNNMSGALFTNIIDNPNGNLIIGPNADVIYLGSEINNDQKVINIGGPNDTVNILGSLNSIQTTNTEIKDKLITLNQGASGSYQSGLCGIQFRDNDDNNAGYITTDVSSNGFLIKAPNNDTIFKIKQSPNEFYDLTTKLYVDLQDSILQSSIAGLNATTTELSNQITTINNNTINDVAFSRINAWPSNQNYLLNGAGQFVKVNNNVIVDNTINPLKLTGANGDATKILYADGTFKTAPSGSFSSSTVVSNSNIVDGSLSTVKLTGISSNNTGNNYLNDKGQFVQVSGFNNSFTANVDAQNYKINNLSDPVNSQDASTKYYVDNKYLNSIETTSQEVIPPPGYLGVPQFIKTFNIYDDVNMNNKNIKNVADGTDPNDAINKSQLDNVIIENSNLLDNTISTSKLSGVLSTNDGLSYLNNKGEFVVVSGGGGSSFDNYFYANVDANNFKIINLGNPTLNTDAVNKTYVDSKKLNQFLADGEISTVNNNLNVGTGTLISNNIASHNSTNISVLAPLDMGNRRIINLGPSGTITSTNWTSINITVDKPLKLVINMRETSSTGFGNLPFRNQEVAIFSNKADTWANTRYYLYGGNSSYMETLTNGGSTASSIGSYLVSGSYTAGSSLSLSISFGVISLRLQNSSQIYDWYVAYQF